MRVRVSHVVEDFHGKNTKPAKPTKAEEEKKKKAYYAKTEKKAKEVKK